MALSPCDPCSYSRPDVCIVRNIYLDLEVDFPENVIAGHAHLTVEKKQDDCKLLILDTRDLSIKQVKDRETGQVLQFSHCLEGNTHPFGSKLEIVLPSSSDKKLTVSIEYSTSPNASALQWLRPEQTAGKRRPYLFSQCQAIHARSLIPCQDTPAVKFTYSAKVKAPREITVLMSAVRQGEESCPGDATSMTHQFVQSVPIPSYLLAIVAGDLECRVIGPRSKVWSEKELVDKAAFEFDETEQMLQTAEALLGKYEWGQYDLLVLPPSFPFGGMENPCLTFVTPTLLAGDKSLAGVVAHEIAHSWTGNLVTNSTFEDFWLNEGHTVFVERKILSRMNGGELMREFLSSAGWNTLQEQIETLNKAGEGAYTKLIPDLKGVDPDDAFSSVPYEKGSAFLFYLERLLGGPAVFEPFLRAYVEHFKFQSISSQQWKDFLFSYFSSEDDQKLLKTVDWDVWFYAEGMPCIQNDYDTSVGKPSQDLSARWIAASDSDLSEFTAEDLKEFSSLQKRGFLSLLLESAGALSLAKIEAMDRLYQFGGVANSEIRFRWLRLNLRVHRPSCISGALDFVAQQGRMKFVRPIYRDLYAWEGARQSAVDWFGEHRAEMHNTTAKEVAKDLHLGH